MSTKKTRRPSKRRTAWLKGLRHARTVHAQVAGLLLRYPNVLTVGVGVPEKRGRRGGEAAIIVGVKHKEDVREDDALPRELMGVRIDVKETPPARLTAGPEVRAGMQCRGQNREEFGHLGVMGRLADGRAAAVTVLHVLVDEQIGSDVDGGDFRDLAIEASLVGGFRRVGTLNRGGFSSHEDVALVRLDDDVEPTALLTGSNILIDDPASLTNGAKAVQLLAPGGPYDGRLEELDVAGAFETAAGPQTFFGLAKFSVETGRIELGWCGSPICTKVTTAPVALLSFGSTTGTAFAYGFPLAPHWQAWGLTSVEDDSQ